jgi:hypothetical protein
MRGTAGGARLYLEKWREETTGPLLEEVRASADEVVGSVTGDFVKFVVNFRVGRAGVLRAGSLRRRGAERALRARQPVLAAFLDAATTALVRVEFDEAVHIGGFQQVTTWRPGAARRSRPGRCRRKAWKP